MELKNQLAWSCSRISLFEHCKRKYYYTYYGAWGGWESNASDETKELYLLKNLRSMAIAVGQIVHDIVDQALKKSQRGERFSYEKLSHDFNRLFNFAIQLSEHKMYHRKPKLQGIVGYEYNKKPTQEEIEEHRDKGLQCLKTFCESEMLQRILESDKTKWLFPEKFTTYQIGNEAAFARFDFAYENEGSIIIIDFKTGNNLNSEINNQARAYCHYFWKTRNYKPENIHFLFWGLQNDTVIEHICSEEDYLKFEKEVLGDLEKMKSLLTDKDNNQTIIDNFPRTEEIVYCRDCEFRRCCK